MLKVPIGIFSKPMRPRPRVRSHSQQNVGGEQRAEEHHFGCQEQPDANLGVI